MNTKNTLLLLLMLTLPALLLSEEVSVQPAESIKQLLEEKLNGKPLSSDNLSDSAPEQTVKSIEKKYSFVYHDVLLVDVINEFAAEKKINILLPQGSQAITTKLHYSLPQKVTLDQAWNELNKILELLGYTWELKNNQLTLLKIDANIQREPLILYSNPALEDLPDTGQVIQTIFYLSNLKVNDQNSPIDAILKGPTGMLSPTAIVKSDPKTNALIITDKSNTIRAAMTIIRQLDLEGIPDDIQVIPLYYVQATFIEDLFKKLFSSAATPVPTGQTRDTGGKTSSYFPPNTKVLALSRTNNIVIMGTTRAIRIVKEFIIKYIDFPLDSGKSILHLYDLQYLNAEEFGPILQALVDKGGATSQSQGAPVIGPRRDFQGVIIEAEKTSITAAIAPTAAEGAPAAAQSEGVQQGGNRLVIAARKEDWRRIKKLIKELDTPQPQVAIEVLVVDLTLDHQQLLGSQLRNNSGFNNSFSNNVNFQTANLAAPIVKAAVADANGFSTPPANALAANLFQFSTENVNFANSVTPGSILISFNDKNNSGIWNVIQLLDQYTNNTILTQPFIVTSDNKQASISISQDRLLAGGANADGGAVGIKNEYVTAATSIDILPTISEGTSNINLQINITVNQFLSTANNRATRLVQTNANVGDGEVLALGGLVRTTDTITESRTPLLARIPLIGWLFKKRDKAQIKNNLMIFICPRIIKPRLGGGVDPYTENKLCLAENNLQEEANFEDLRDPITRWFFKPDPNYAHDVIDDYVELQPEMEKLEKPRDEQRDKIKELERLIRNEENPLLEVDHQAPNQLVLNP